MLSSEQDAPETREPDAPNGVGVASGSEPTYGAAREARDLLRRTASAVHHSTRLRWQEQR